MLFRSVRSRSDPAHGRSDSPFRPCRSGSCASGQTLRPRDGATAIAARPSHLDRARRSRAKPTPRPRPGSPLKSTPAGLRRRGALAAEVVLDPDDVIELGRRHLDETAGLDGLVAVRPAGAHVGALAGPELPSLDNPLVVLERQPEAAVDDVDPLVLVLVVLERQAL